MAIRYIPEFYPITWDEYQNSQKLEGKEIDPEMEQFIKDAQAACNAYADAVSLAVEQARKLIEPFQHKNILYSRTWGK